MNYYNEFDPKAAAWLRELINRGLIPDGHVDERSIVDVRGADLAGYNQCHFFAGIGGWPLALRLAGWPAGCPVWTGSCPCQPFSSAGKQAGFADKRHLWPEFFRLIAECKPSVCFGEQVASKLGREWLAGVRANLEALGYEVGAANLCAAGVGAPHIRQRLYWVGHTIDAGLEGHGESGIVEIPKGRQGTERHGSRASRPWDNYDIMHFADGKTRRIEPGLVPLANGIPARMVRLRGYGNAIVPPLAAEFIKAYMSIRS